MERVKFGGERFIVQTFGRPMAVLISYEDFLAIEDFLPRMLRLNAQSRGTGDVLPRVPVQERLGAEALRRSVDGTAMPKRPDQGDQPALIDSEC